MTVAQEQVISCFKSLMSGQIPATAQRAERMYIRTVYFYAWVPVCVRTRVLEAWSAPPSHPAPSSTNNKMDVCAETATAPSLSLILQRSVSTRGQEHGDNMGCMNHVEFEKNTDKVISFAQEHSELSVEHYRKISALQSVCFYSVIRNGSNGKGLKIYTYLNQYCHDPSAVSAERQRGGREIKLPL